MFSYRVKLDLKHNADSFAGKVNTADRYTTHTLTTFSCDTGKDCENSLKCSRVLPEEPKIPLEYETPVAQQESIYEDPDKLTKSPEMGSSEIEATMGGSYDGAASYEVMVPGAGLVEEKDENAGEVYCDMQ